MAKSNINLTDNISIWVSKANTTVNRVGDLADLSTTHDSSLVGSINELSSNVDARLALTGGTMSGAIAMGTSKITGMGDPTAAQDAATKTYVDNQVSAAGGGDLLATNNLSDLTNTTTARTNLGVAIGSDVQAHSSVLDGTTASFTTTKDNKLTGIDTGANNYVHPNHTGEVTSTADGATVIANNVVDEANLKVSNSPQDGYSLTAQSGAAGGLTWASVSLDADTVSSNELTNEVRLRIYNSSGSVVKDLYGSGS